MVERDGLENRCTLTRTEGSNPSLSAIQSGLCTETRGDVELLTRIQNVTAIKGSVKFTNIARCNYLFSLNEIF